jgi:hypothetical protein
LFNNEDIPKNKNIAAANGSQLRDFRRRRRLKSCYKGFSQYQNKDTKKTHVTNYINRDNEKQSQL